MSDTDGYALITYNTSTSGFCRIESDYMKPINPDFTNESFRIPDGIDAVTVIQNKGKYFFFNKKKDIVFKNHMLRILNLFIWSVVSFLFQYHFNISLSIYIH